MNRIFGGNMRVRQTVVGLYVFTIKAWGSWYKCGTLSRAIQFSEVAKPDYLCDTGQLTPNVYDNDGYDKSRMDCLQKIMNDKHFSGKKDLFIYPCD